MKIDLTADLGFGANIEKLIYELIDKISPFFKSKKYGNASVEIFMVVVCSSENFKIRKRFDRKEKVLYWDVMPDFNKIKKAKVKLKKKILAEAIINSFDILDNYKKLHLNKEELKKDLAVFFSKLEWI